MALGAPVHRAAMVKAGVVAPLCHLLWAGDDQTLQAALRALASLTTGAVRSRNMLKFFWQPTANKQIFQIVKRLAITRNAGDVLAEGKGRGGAATVH
jgi:hypothetical protein